MHTQKHSSGRNRQSRRRGQTLIALLVVVLVGFGMYFMFLGPRRGADGELRPSIAKESINKSETVAVMGNNISQIEQAISMYRMDNEGKPPASLEELKSSAYAKGFPAEMWIDPVSKQPLIYDPQTGTISAPPRPGAQPGAPAPAQQPLVPAPGGNIPADLLN
jgi:type II secretory pathway pseudopilin PulG